MVLRLWPPLWGSSVFHTLNLEQSLYSTKKTSDVLPEVCKSRCNAAKMTS